MFVTLLMVTACQVQLVQPMQSAEQLEANKAVVARVYDEIMNEGNIDAVEEVFSPDFVDNGIPMDHATIRAIMTGLRAGLPDLEVTTDVWVAEDDLVTTLVTFRGTHQGEWMGVPATGRPITWTHTESSRVENGQIQAVWHNIPFAEQFQQMGVLPRRGELEANKEIIRRFYDDLWNEGNLAVADEIISPDFEDGFSGQVGIEPLKGTVQMFRDAFPDMQIGYTDMVVEGDLVVVTIRNEMGAYAGGLPEFFGIPDSAIGKEVVLQGIDYARIENGKMVAGWGTHDILGWMEQFGLELVPVEE